MANLCLINRTHGTVDEGGLKSHILNLETGDILCGRNISGGFGAGVDYDYLTSQPIPVLMKYICVRCLKRAFDVMEVELDKY